jgi:hypothetical protein
MSAAPSPPFSFVFISPVIVSRMLAAPSRPFSIAFISLVCSGVNSRTHYRSSHRHVAHSSSSDLWLPIFQKHTFHKHTDPKLIDATYVEKLLRVVGIETDDDRLNTLFSELKWMSAAELSTMTWASPNRPSTMLSLSSTHYQKRATKIRH